MNAAWHERQSSRALFPFTKGRALPYTADGVVVTALTPRDGVIWGSPNKGSNVHLIETMAAAWTEHGLIIGARWVCGGSSIGAKPIRPELYWASVSACYIKSGHTDPDEAVCLKCRQARDGVVPLPSVYRAYDKHGALLYVGSTKNWLKRWAQHKNTTWWWPVVKDIDVTEYATLEEARDAEAFAIKDEAPRFNIQHNRGRAS